METRVENRDQWKIAENREMESGLGKGGGEGGWTNGLLEGGRATGTLKRTL